MRSIMRLDSGSDSCSAMLRASSARSCQCSGSSRMESDTTVFIRSSASGTISPGPTLHRLDRRHAYVERMPTACRRMPDARESDHANLREAGVARTCGRVPTNCRRIGTPQLSFHWCEAPARLLKAFLLSSLRRRTLTLDSKGPSCLRRAPYNAVPENCELVISRNEKPRPPFRFRTDLMEIPWNCVCEFRPCGARTRGTERQPGTLHKEHAGTNDSEPRLGTHAIPNNEQEENRMGFFSKDIKTMDDLFVHTLQDI